jgi:hypothetical protein
MQTIKYSLSLLTLREVRGAAMVCYFRAAR